MPYIFIPHCEKSIDNRRCGVYSYALQQPPIYHVQYHGEHSNQHVLHWQHPLFHRTYQYNQ